MEFKSPVVRTQLATDNYVPLMPSWSAHCQRCSFCSIVGYVLHAPRAWKIELFAISIVSSRDISTVLKNSTHKFESMTSRPSKSASSTRLYGFVSSNLVIVRGNTVSHNITLNDQLTKAGNLGNHRDPNLPFLAWLLVTLVLHCKGRVSFLESRLARFTTSFQLS